MKATSRQHLDSQTGTSRSQNRLRHDPVPLVSRSETARLEPRSITSKVLSTIESLGPVVDRLVAIIDPTRARLRLADREAVDKQLATYAAARTTRLTGDWYAPSTSINDILRGDNSTILSRARQLTRDMPHFDRGIRIIVNFSVGTGITRQSMVKDSDGVYDTKVNQKIDDAIERFNDECDFSGDLHRQEMSPLCKRTETEAGEFIAIMRMTKIPGSFIPLKIQLLESEWFDSAALSLTPQKGNAIDQGVEFNLLTGRRVNYHFRAPAGGGMYGAYGQPGTIFTVPASMILHGFETKRPGQLRGVSPWVAAITIARDLDQYVGSTVDVAKMAAKYLAFVHTETPQDFTGYGDGFTKTGEKIEDLENAMILYLREREKVTFATNPAPGDNFKPFTDFCFRILAISSDTPYELLSGDYSALDYSSLRGSRNDFITMLRPHTMRHIRHFDAPIDREVIRTCVLTGKLDLPGFWKDPSHYYACEYTGPGMASPDPLREGLADQQALDGCRTSPQDVAAKSGKNIRDIYAKIAEADRLRTQYNITPKAVPVTSKTNPAAVAPDSEATVSETATAKGAANGKKTK